MCNFQRKVGGKPESFSNVVVYDFSETESSFLVLFEDYVTGN